MPYPSGLGNALNYFAGGPAINTDNTTTSVTQTIDVSPAATAIDDGKIPFTLSGYLGGYSDQDDNAVLTIQFQDAAHQQLGKASIGPVMASDRQSLTSILQRSTNGTVPT
ncbi:MAG TPA: hypothetical protein VHV10_09640, partial [Ktedonobacteraceae bacterium]|nr:hypothetical protein [Ktedonobacteraceae bacterium]